MGTKVLPKRTSNPSSIPIEDGNLIFDTGTKRIFMDDEDGQRYQYGGINAVDTNFDVSSSNAIANKTVTKLIQEQNITLTVENWTGSKPYTQTVEIEGMTANGKPDIYLAYGDDQNESNDKALEKNFNYIKFYDSGLNSITFTCKYNKPTIALPILVKGIF